MRRLVLFVTPGFPLPSQTFIVSKFLGLLANGWDVHLVAPASEAADWRFYPELLAPDIRQRIHVLPLREPDDAAIRQTIIALKPDLLHFEFKWPAVRWIDLKQRLGCKIVVSIRASDFDYTQPREFYNILWHNADGLHVLGQDLWRRARKLGCPAALKHVLIPAAIDAEFWDPGVRMPTAVLGSQERPLRLLTVSRLEWTKGIEYAFAVVRQLVDEGVHCEYRVIGDGKYADAIHFARQQMGLGGVVQLLGAQPRELVRDALLWADLFLHTAVLEGFCNAVLEAQAMQLPIVCSDADGLPENVANGQTGFVLPQRDSAAMAEKISLLCGNPGLRSSMGQAGRKRVLQQFQVAHQIAAFDTFYREILANE